MSRSTSSWPRLALFCLLLLHTACGGERRAAAAEVERGDSAGIEVVMNRGGDVPLEWRFEEALRLGGRDEGPEAFSGLMLGSDGAGNLHVFDRSRSQVITFDPRGRHLRSVGRSGGGPGEIQFALGFAVSPEGVAHVFDAARRGLVRWDAEGGLLPDRPLELRFFGGRLQASGSGLVLVAQGQSDNPSVMVQELTFLPWEGEPEVLARGSTEVFGPVSYPNCPVQISAQPRLLAHSLVWGGSGRLLAVNERPAYEVLLYRDGEPFRSVRRDVPPRAATQEDARAELPDPFTISFGSGECRIPVSDAIAAQGMAETVPPIRRLAAAPDGTLWVGRSGTQQERQVIDLFTPDGEYLGTLDGTFRFPSAFTPAGDPITVERDELDLEYVVVWRRAG
jgi:hypothetical protein